MVIIMDKIDSGKLRVKPISNGWTVHMRMSRPAYCMSESRLSLCKYQPPPAAAKLAVAYMKPDKFGAKHAHPIVDINIMLQVSFGESR